MSDKLRSTLKKYAAVLLAALTVCPLLVSCGSGGSADTPAVTAETGSPSVTTEAETTAPSPLELLGEADFDGREFRIYEHNGTPDLQVNIPGEAMTGEAVNDALILRDIAISERYNVTFSYFSPNENSTLRKSVQAGDSEYRLLISRLMDAIDGLATSGILMNLYDIPFVEITADWWSPSFCEGMTLNNCVYYTSGDLAPSVYQAACCMFLNLKLMDDYGIKVDIYDEVINGGWTLDILADMTKGMYTDVNGDGRKDLTDTYGVVLQHTTETSNTLITGAGIDVCTVTNGGTSLVCDLAGNAKAISAIEKLSTMFDYINYDEINDPINITFKQNHALFLIHKLESAAVHLRDMEADYLVLPLPKLSESQASYRSCVSGWCSSFVGVPICGDGDTEFTGFITEALERYCNENLRPLAFEVAYKDKYTRDARIAEVLDILFDNLYTSFATVYNFGGINDVITNTIFQQKELISALAAKESTIQTQMEKLISVWGMED